MPRNREWMMRTYAGHTDPQAANELFRRNLAKGQTGLSVAFDLPTQIGFDSDHPAAKGEVGKVGVPICHVGDMEALFAEIPLENMNTSMTINATAAWLLALYVAVAEGRGIEPRVLKGTTQNDILKELLSRGTHRFPPEPSLRLTADVIQYTTQTIPSWNPVNVCDYHLQEAGATPVQEIAYTLANAFAILERVKGREGVSMSDVIARISFFCNAGIRFIEEMCKLKALTRMWNRETLERYGVNDPKARRFRYGVQVNSLGLTAQQPENNVQRIVLEMLAVTLSKEARALSVQLPAWNEALGLPRPWDQQWALRMQQVLAFETDLLDCDGDIFEGSKIVEGNVEEMMIAATTTLAELLAISSLDERIEVMKRGLVASHAQRLRRIESGETKVVGLNCFEETEPSPLTTGADQGILVVDPEAERRQIERLQVFRKTRNPEEVDAALAALADAARTGENIMPVSIRCARAGVTTGEWAGALEKVFGQYRGPTGVQGVSVRGGEGTSEASAKVKQAAEALGHPLKLLVAKPGLDGHANGAEQIAVGARDAGIEVIYGGIRYSPEEIAAAATDEDVDAVAISIHSGAHMTLVPATIKLLRDAGMDIPVAVGGIIPEADRKELRKLGVALIAGPGEMSVPQVIEAIADLVIKYATEPPEEI